MAKILSGPSWVTLFPNSASPNDLTEPFRANAKSFLAALAAAGASVNIATTLRSTERAYLMHWSFKIAKQNSDPAAVPAMTGVDIEWAHRDPQGNVNLGASRLAAQAMVTSYGIVFQPALTSRHTEGRAVDMTITWATPQLVIKKADGTSVTIAAGAKNGSNTLLHAVGASYGVTKLVSDPPHWSTDGH